ncbi:Adaptor protein complex beta subunit [Backusella circina FSU 941]|nr:Adaptor protein complex beta subunit [Backusella circina FSU 941]
MYFNPLKKGEIYKLRNELNSEYRHIRNDGVKKAIASMAIGKDVSGLFPDVKLVYLHLINYAKTQSKLAILAVNTFDSDNPKPLICALAIRTMGCIHQRYVLGNYSMESELTKKEGFLDILKDMIADVNPVVVADVVISPQDIDDKNITAFKIEETTVNTPLHALNECNEPKDEKETDSIFNHVLPRLQHANGAVVLSTVKALHLVGILATKFSRSRGVYNDSLYAKLEKLEIFIFLCNNRNVYQILTDVYFAKKSINAIVQCTIKIAKATESCINILLDLINNDVNYIVQEAIVIIKYVFRKYLRMYEMIIPQLRQNMEALDKQKPKIDHADDLIALFLENFIKENAQVQLQLLTAPVKMFLKKPNENQGLIQSGLHIASTKCGNADIRDRAYIYWRLLSTDPQTAKVIILSDKPLVEDEMRELSPGLLDTLIVEIETLTSAYHKKRETFIGGKILGADNVTCSTRALDIEDNTTSPPEKIHETIKNNDVENLLDLDWSEPAPLDNEKLTLSGSSNPLDDLFSLSSTPTTSAVASSGIPSTVQSTQNQPNNDDMIDFFGCDLSACNRFSNILKVADGIDVVVAGPTVESRPSSSSWLSSSSSSSSSLISVVMELNKLEANWVTLSFIKRVSEDEYLL